VSDDRDEALADSLRTAGRRRAFGGRGERDVLAAIALGGAMGTPARYEISQLIQVAKDTFPWATLVTNLSGAFVLGLFLTLVIERFPPARYSRAFFAIGFLGSFTTFSTMAVETVTLVKDHRAVLGISYLCVSIAAGLASCYLGIVLARVSPLGGDTAPR
jgi:fluoride exporter